MKKRNFMFFCACLDFEKITRFFTFCRQLLSKICKNREKTKSSWKSTPKIVKNAKRSSVSSARSKRRPKRAPFGDGPARTSLVAQNWSAEGARPARARRRRGEGLMQQLLCCKPEKPQKYPSWACRATEGREPGPSEGEGRRIAASWQAYLGISKWNPKEKVTQLSQLVARGYIAWLSAQRALSQRNVTSLLAEKPTAKNRENPVEIPR